MSIHMGDRVKVIVSSTSHIPKNPIEKFNGQEFTVKKVKLSYIAKSPRRQYTLFGCESDYGLPYWFGEEDVIKI